MGGKSTSVLFQKKVKGGALYISIMISIIIGIILTMFILIGQYNHRNVTVFSQTSQLNFNLKSAFEIARSDYFTEERNNRWFKNSGSDDSIKIKRQPWGAYLMICTETKNRHHKLSQSGLYGTYLNSDTALLVSDNSRPVGFSGSVIFKGNCYLPKAGVKAAYLEGQSYAGDQGNSSYIKASGPSIPEIDQAFKNSIRRQQNELDPYTDSLIPLNIQQVRHPFNLKTLVFEQGNTTLSNMDLAGNIKLICKNVTVDPTCRLENVLIVCDKIVFKEGFKGSVHVIAADSITVEKKCELMFPSSLVISARSGKSNQVKSVLFKEDSKFSGGILAFKNSPLNDPDKVFVKLSSKCEINGLVYSENYIHIEGEINGTIISDKLLLKTPSAVYENHILACKIDPKKYAHLLAVPGIHTKKGKLVCCRNLQ
jgi:hypothetical protein